MRAFWHGLLGLDLALIGLLVVASLLTKDPGTLTRDSIILASLVNAVMMGVIPVFWAQGIHGPLWKARLGWTGVSHIPHGLAAGVGVVLVLWAAILVAIQLGFQVENPQGDALVAVLDWPSALLVVFVAATAEEILFRGLLQKWVGIWGQAALFGLVHVDYGTPLQVIIPAILGLGLGWARNRYGLGFTMGVHFTFNFVQMAAVLALR